MSDQPSAKPILFYSDSRYYSGAEKVFTMLIEGLAARHPGSLVILSPEIEKAFKAALPQWQSLPLTYDFSATQLKLKLSEIGRLTGLIKKQGLTAALINMWSPYANTLALLAAAQAGIPRVTCFHYFESQASVGGVLKPVKLAAYAWVAKTSTVVVTVSTAHKRLLTDEFHFPADKVRVIHNGLPPSPHTGHAKHPAQPRRLLAVGTLQEEKGYRYLLPILAKLVGEWTLSVAGDGPQKEELQALCQELKLEKKVRFLGRRQDMESLYTEHDLLIHPSYFENFSLSILEAMAHGLPVLAHDVGGNREEITPGKEGWLIPLRNDTAWITALSEALSTDLEPYSRRAIEKWQKELQAEQMLEGYEHLLQHLPQGKK